MFYGPENTDVQNANALLDKVNQQIRDHVRKMIQGYASMAAIALDHSEALQIRLDEVKKEERKATTKYRPYSRAKEKLDELKKIKASLHIRLLAEQVDVNIPTAAIVDIIDPAVKSLKPDRPNIPLNLALGIVFGLVVGVGLAFFIEYLDTSVKTIDDVEAALQAPVLGVIPQNVGSLLDEGPDSPHAEAYRVLRTNMTFSRKDPTKNSLTVVSGGAGEGKSTTLFNLAVVFAQEGQKVLIVDSDLRRPSIHKMMHVTNSIGLTNYLLGQNTLEEVIQTSINPFMDFMPSGKLPSSSMGILNSPQMKELIKSVKARYDFVLFDSPPIMGVSDASILASEVDLAIQVIQYRKYPQAMTIRAKQMVEKVGGNLLGVVLNNINISQDENYYYYSGYYYDYYYSRRDDDDSDDSKKSRKKSGNLKRSGDSKKASSAKGETAVNLKTKY